MTGFDLLDPFLPSIGLNPEYSASDDRRAIEAMALRTDLITDLLQGSRPLDDVLDCISDQGEDPDQWLGDVIGQVNYVMDNGVPFVSNESGILLPASCLG